MVLKTWMSKTISFPQNILFNMNCHKKNQVQLYGELVKR